MKQNIRIRIDDVQLPMVVNSTEEEKRYRDAAAHIEIASKGVEVSNSSSIEPYKKSIEELREEIAAALAD